MICSAFAPDAWSSGCTLSLEMMKGLVEAMIQCDGKNVAFRSREESFTMVCLISEKQ